MGYTSTAALTGFLLVSFSCATIFDAYGQEQSPSELVDQTAPFIPEKYLINQDPPGLPSAGPVRKQIAPPEANADEPEKGSAVSGQLYTVIAPIFLGGGPDGGNTSYVRFFNAGSVTSTFNVRLVAYKTDSLADSKSVILGAVTVTVPSMASLQYSISDIFNTAGIGTIACTGTCPPDVYQGLSLYVSNNNNGFAGFQHVIYNSNSLFFENVSVCGDTTLSDGKFFLNTSNVINVHTTRIPGYPASVMFHNYSAFNTTYRFQIYDANTGVQMGTYVATALANSTYIIPMSVLETQIGWTPTASQFHANVLIANNTVGASYNGYAGALIYNQALQAYINMSQICNVAH